jgi:hypothetical protein
MVKEEKKRERKVECDHFYSHHVHSTYLHVFISLDDFMLIEGQVELHTAYSTNFSIIFGTDTLTDKGTVPVK